MNISFPSRNDPALSLPLLIGSEAVQKTAEAQKCIFSSNFEEKSDASGDLTELETTLSDASTEEFTDEESEATHIHHLDDKVKEAMQNRIPYLSAKEVHRMIKNFEKAVDDHGSPIQPLHLARFSESASQEPAHLQFGMSSHIGKRASMEDALFHTPIDQGPYLGFLAGVFDGHNNAALSSYAATWFPMLFKWALTSKSIIESFEQTLIEIDGKFKAFSTQGHALAESLKHNFNKEMLLSFLKTHSDFIPPNVHAQFLDKITQGMPSNAILAFLKKHIDSGSTAVICFIDQRNRIVYTATLGDSEAKIYRTDPDCVIPLSPLRHWGKEKEAERVVAALENPSHPLYMKNGWNDQNYAAALKNDFLDQRNIKNRRFPPLMGVNVSRALGDHQFDPGHQVIKLKPKVTMTPLMSGDYLIMGSDGLWDYISDVSFSIMLGRKFTHCSEIAKDAVAIVLANSGQDNVTVFVVSVK